jgi:hypothetical protein
MNKPIIIRPGRVILASLGVLLAVAIVLGTRSPQNPVVNGQKLATALAQYARDCRSRGQTLPPTIPMQTLVAQGYLDPGDTKALNGIELVFHTDVDSSRPTSVLAEANTPDGQIQAVLADGSVQQFSKERWAEYQAQQNGPAKTALPGQGTNSSINAGEHR